MRMTWPAALGLLVAVTGCASAAPKDTAAASAAPTGSAATSGRPSAGHPAAVGPVQAAGLGYSTASASSVQQQPSPGQCHVRGSGLFVLPDRSCTPGMLNPAVTQASIGATICVSGYTRTIRPPVSVTEPEKYASLAAYGDPASPGAYEYDHLVPLELGGAANDPRNLWPEPGSTPNPKDELENRLHALVCDGTLRLDTAQRAIAGDWVAAYATYLGAPAAPAPAAAPTAGTGPCRATVSDATPTWGEHETVTVMTTAAATVRTIAHYKTTDTEHDGTADARGVWAVTFSIGHATAGFTVEVDVVTSSHQACATSFTPR